MICRDFMSVHFATTVIRRNNPFTIKQAQVHCRFYEVYNIVEIMLQKSLYVNYKKCTIVYSDGLCFFLSRYTFFCEFSIFFTDILEHSSVIFFILLRHYKILRKQA